MNSTSENLKWFCAYIGIGVGLALFIRFPISLLILIGLIITINTIRSKRALAKMGMKASLSDLFRAYSTDQAAISPGIGQAVKYYCMICGKENNNIECGYCGSKMRRAS